MMLCGVVFGEHRGGRRGDVVREKAVVVKEAEVRRLLCFHHLRSERR